MNAAHDYGARRGRMVDEQLVHRGIRDEGVLAAMRSVPRHLFVPEDLAPEAYADTPLPIGHGQTISQPYMVALMTALLEVDVRSRVLEVGSGSGYQTAVLAEMAGEVYALELLAALSERARATLARLGYRNVHLAIGDGTRGWSEQAPFDAVLVAAAPLAPPPALLDQLAEGGRLAIPLGQPHGEQVLTVFQRSGDRFVQRRETRCRFVPLVSSLHGEGEPRGGEDAPGVSTVALRETALDYERGAAMRAVRVRVSGRVQGVFYRAGAVSEGRRLGLKGWVRNEGDGTVALHLQGDPSVVDAMLDWCRIGPSAARVTRVEVCDAMPDGSFSDFEVR